MDIEDQNGPIIFDNAVYYELRNAAIEEKYLQGQTLQEIGGVYRLTRERVRQILKKRGVDPQAGGIALVRRITPPKVKVSKRKVYPVGYHFCHKCGLLDKDENFYQNHSQGRVTFIHKPCRKEYMKERARRAK